MDVVRSQYYTFDKYIKRINFIGDKNPQERNYQELISEFLKEIFIITDIEVIDVSNNRNTKIHNRSIYSGDDGPPDLLLTRKYQYKNVNSKDTEYIAAIEIKVPNEWLNSSKLIRKYKNQLESHLSKNQKVIITDCITWCFLENNGMDNKEDLQLIKSFKLKDDSNQWKAKKRKFDEFVKEMLNQESDYLKSKEWDELQNYIREFVC